MTNLLPIAGMLQHRAGCAQAYEAVQEERKDKLTAIIPVVQSNAFNISFPSFQECNKLQGNIYRCVERAKVTTSNLVHRFYISTYRCSGTVNLVSALLVSSLLYTIQVNISELVMNKHFISSLLFCCSARSTL